MGGSKPSAPTPQPVPEPAEKLDYNKMFAASRENSRLTTQDQIDQLKASYPEFENLQLGTINRLAGQLNNDYAARANTAIAGATQNAARLNQAGDQIGGLVATGQENVAAAQEFANGPTAIDRQIGALGSAAMSQRADQVEGAQVRPVGDIRASAAERGLMREAAGRGILGQLEGQASSDLALGRSLSAEQQRDATQSARAGYAARGLATGQSAMAAELLNRDRFAAAREAERRAFASGVANQGANIRQAANAAYMGRMESNVGRRQQAALADAGYAQQAAMTNQDANQRQVEANRAYMLNANNSGINSQITRGNYASQMLGQASGLYGQQAAAYQNAAALGLNVANANLTVDPYQRAFAPGASFAQGNSGQAMNTIGTAYGNALNTIGNVDTFNTNMLETRRNSALNNNASMQGAYMSAQAQYSAGQNAMWGGIGQGALAAGGTVAGSMILASAF